MAIKLIALDLDDTLLNRDNQISSTDGKAIGRAMERGIKITLSTGRMFASAVRFAKELNIFTPLITYQGAYARAVNEEKPFFEAPLNMPLAKEVIALGMEEGLGVQVYVKDRLCVPYIDGAVAKYCQRFGVRAMAVGDIKGWLHNDPHKVLLRGEAGRLDGLWPLWQDYFKERVYITKSKPYYLEFVNPKADKGKTLTLLAENLGFKKEEVMACGDSYNDLPLFEAAGLKIAMGNAINALKEKADYITAPNYERGVAEAIYKFAL